MKLPAAPSMQAIPTTYNGITFRSRLEARWCRLLDLLGIDWRYEHEGYEYDGVRYLCDFWLPELDLYLEVKPFADVFPKQIILAVGSGKTVLVGVGDVQDRTVVVITPASDGVVRTKERMHWCPQCRDLTFEPQDSPRTYCPLCGSSTDVSAVARQAQNEQFWIPANGNHVVTTESERSKTIRQRFAVVTQPDPFSDDPPYTVGMRVYHPVFGYGDVLDVGHGHVSVDFDEHLRPKSLLIAIVRDVMVAA